jgi:hypothetical protein
MPPQQWFFRERSLSKVVAIFRQPEAAEKARDQVKDVAGLEDRQVQVVGPRDPQWSRKLEPEGVGIARTAIRAHLTCALAGLSLALVAWSLMYLADVVVIASTPLPSLIALALFGTMLGLMLGGALTMRPDHELMIDKVRQATRTGRWALVVHPVSRSQFDLALAMLQSTGAPVARTL